MIASPLGQKVRTGFLLVLGLFCCLMDTLAQSPGPQTDPLMQLMLNQPGIEISTNVEIRAEFEPPVVGVGEKSIYRVTITALSDSIRWPDSIYAPMALTIRESARGQILQAVGGQYRPSTTINHHVRSAEPGSFTVPEFRVKVYDQSVTVPAAQLSVLESGTPTPPPPHRLWVALSETNAFVGQSVRVRVYMPGGTGNVIQSLVQVQINGDGLLVDQSSVRQSIQPMELGGYSGATYVYEASVTPLVAGRIDVTAQGFRAGNRFSGAITIQGQATIPGGMPDYELLDSDPVQLEVDPLPRIGELPGFNGAIGQFALDEVQVSTNRIPVGETMRLFVTILSTNETRPLTPPAPPVSTNWQIFPPRTEAEVTLTATPGTVISRATFSYTLIPLTNDIQATPPLPFSFFEPGRRTYVDLTIPPVAVQVTTGTVSAAAQAVALAAAAMTNEARLKLSELSPGIGRQATLMPLQLRPGFWLVQLVPLLGFSGLWFWDRRRRFFEQHPELLVRRRARRALRRERASMERALRLRDGASLRHHAINSLRVAAAPHFPAAPRALVGRDILQLLGGDENPESMEAAVRELFDSENATRFGSEVNRTEGLLALAPELERILDQLEMRLR